MDALLQQMMDITNQVSKTRQQVETDNLVHASLAEEEMTAGTSKSALPPLASQDTTTLGYSDIQKNLQGIEKGYNQIFTNLSLDKNQSASTLPLQNAMMATTT